MSVKLPVTNDLFFHDRLCKNCSDNLVEDKVHLLLDYSKFNDLGRDFVTGCFNKNINRTNDISSTLITLLSNKDNCVCRKMARCTFVLT